MTVKELMDYFVRTNADPEATLFLDTGDIVLELKSIIECKTGIYLTSDE